MKIAAYVVLPATLLSACASNPPVTMKYSLPRADLQLTVARTVACDTTGAPVVATTVTPKVAYSPDPLKNKTFAIKSLDGPFSNAEVGIALLEDGRLAGFNTAQAGQGSEIVEAALMVGGLVLGLAGDGSTTPEQNACSYLKNNAKDGVLTLNFALDKADDLAGDIQFKEINATSEDADRYGNVKVLTKALCYSSTGVPGSGAPPVTTDESWKGANYLELRQPGKVKVEVHRSASLTCTAPYTLLWSGLIAVPQRGTDYKLPIPAAPVFGKQSFTMTLTESGSITTLKYGYESGAAGAMTSVGKALTALKPDDPKTYAEQAAEVKGEADLIAQQERLVLCKADPKNCPK